MGVEITLNNVKSYTISACKTEGAYCISIIFENYSTTGVATRAVSVTANESVTSTTSSTTASGWL